MSGAKVKRRTPKYRNRKTELDGITFDSLREAKRWRELCLLQRAGQITELQRQVPFELAPSVRINGRKRPPLRYIADFVYQERGEPVVEDTKGVITEGYRIKRHLMLATHGIAIREVA